MLGFMLPWIQNKNSLSCPWRIEICALFNAESMARWHIVPLCEIFLQGLFALQTCWIAEMIILWHNKNIKGRNSTAPLSFSFCCIFTVGDNLMVYLACGQGVFTLSDDIQYKRVCALCWDGIWEKTWSSKQITDRFSYWPRAWWSLCPPLHSLSVLEFRC